MQRISAFLFVPLLLAACASAPAPHPPSRSSPAVAARKPTPAIRYWVTALPNTPMAPRKVSFTRAPKSGKALRRDFAPHSENPQLEKYADRIYDEILDAGNTEAARVGPMPRTGKVMISVSILASGRLEAVEIDAPSQFEDINASILKAVRLAAPFPPFPPALASKVDAVTLTKTFLYLPN